MKQQLMEFAGFRWPQNPASLSVSHARQVQTQAVPYGGEILQDLGRRSIVVTGEGVLKGSRAPMQFETLRKFYETGTVDVLRIMGLPPIMARLTKLELVGKYNPDKLGYRFTFCEDITAPLPKRTVRHGDVYTAQEGDNLWQIANENGTTVETLQVKNPQIQWPGFLPTGMQVAL